MCSDVLLCIELRDGSCVRCGCSVCRLLAVELSILCTCPSVFVALSMWLPGISHQECSRGGSRACFVCTHEHLFVIELEIIKEQEKLNKF